MAMFDKSPEWGARFQFPENQEINYDGLHLSVTDKIVTQMVENYDNTIAAEIATVAREIGASDVTVMNKAAIIDALMKRTPKKPVPFHEVHPRHDWAREEKSGEIDLFAASSDYHNGPICLRCYTSKCVHCDPDWNKDEECVVDEDRCPGCGVTIYRPNRYRSSSFCPDCGQAIDWTEEIK